MNITFNTAGKDFDAVKRHVVRVLGGHALHVGDQVLRLLLRAIGCQAANSRLRVVALVVETVESYPSDDVRSAMIAGVARVRSRALCSRATTALWSKALWQTRGHDSTDHHRYTQNPAAIVTGRHCREQQADLWKTLQAPPLSMHCAEEGEGPSRDAGTSTMLIRESPSSIKRRYSPVSTTNSPDTSPRSL